MPIFVLSTTPSLNASTASEHTELASGACRAGIAKRTPISQAPAPGGMASMCRTARAIEGTRVVGQLVDMGRVGSRYYLGGPMPRNPALVPRRD